MNPLPLLPLLLCASSVPLLQETVEEDSRLEALVGEYEVRARLWPRPGSQPIEVRGHATWERSHGRRYLHESFELEHDGRILSGDAWLAWRPEAGRYELVQIDDFNPTSFWLVGGWDAERGRIALDDLAETRLPERPALRWEYRFEPDGSFVKEMLVADGEGGFRLASDYLYLPAQRPMATSPRATEIAGTSRADMIPGFNWAVVEVMLNGKGPFRMIADTGAGTTVLHEDLVAELRLESGGTRRIGDPSNPRAKEVDELVIDVIQVGDATFRGVEAVGWRGPALVGIGEIRGVLGLPTFGDCLVTFDYPAERLEIRAGELPPADGEGILDMGTAGMPTISIEVAGVPIEAHLDTGNSSSLSLPGSYEQKLPLVEGSKSQGAGARASGPFEFTRAQLDGDVRLGGVVFEKPWVHFDDSMRSANVGFELLRNLRITFDQRNGLVRFERTPNQREVRRSNAPQGMRRMGVQVAIKDGTIFEAARVMPGSEAEKAGLKAGDAFLELDGNPFSQQAMMDALQGTGSFTLTVDRGGKRLDLVCFEED